MIRIIVVFIVFSLLSMTGCSNFKIANSRMIRADAYKTVKLENISPAEAIFQATEAISQAKEERLDFYSPLHVKKAQQKVAKANSLLRLRSTKRSRVAAATEALVAVKVIEAAKANKKMVESELSVILGQKKVLDEMGAKNHLNDSYSIGMSKVSQLIALVERRKYDRAALLEKSALDYLNKLEANMLKLTSLARVKDMLLKAKSIRAKKYAAATYAKAIDDYKKAVVFIDVNYKDRVAVDVVAKKTYASASHAFYVALEAQKIIHSDARSIENYILDIQQLLSHINEQLGIEGLHSHAFKTQASLIHDKIIAKVLAVSHSKSVEAIQKTAVAAPVVAGIVQPPQPTPRQSTDTAKKVAGERAGREEAGQGSGPLKAAESQLSATKDILTLKKGAAVDDGGRTEFIPPEEEEKLNVSSEEVVKEVTVVKKVIE